MARKHREAAPSAEAQPEVVAEQAAQVPEQAPPAEPEITPHASEAQPAPVVEVAPERTPDAIRADIRAIRQAFIGSSPSRVTYLEEALECKRAEAVADRILALEAELEKLSPAATPSVPKAPTSVPSAAVAI